MGDLPDFFDGVFAEALAAESGLNGHDEDEIDLFEIRDDLVGGGVGIDRDSGEAFGAADLLEGFEDRVFGFGVDGDEIGAGFGEGVDVEMRVVEHQVDVEKEFRAFAKGGDGGGAEGEVGDEMAIHDVDVEPAEGKLLDELGAGDEVAVISGENGRSENVGMDIGHGTTISNRAGSGNGNCRMGWGLTRVLGEEEAGNVFGGGSVFGGGFAVVVEAEVGAAAVFVGGRGGGGA